MFKALPIFIAIIVTFFVNEASAYNGTIDMTLVTFPTSMFEVVAALILAALAVLWIVRKVLQLVRS